MRLSHIHAHIEQQLALSNSIVHAYDYFLKDDLTNVNNVRVNARLSALRNDWEKFSLEHTAITNAINFLTTDDRIVINEHPYFENNLFDLTHERYVESVDRLSSLIDHDQGSIPSLSSANSKTLSIPGLPVLYHQPRLPRIDLPKFNGNASDWLSFKDLFCSLVTSNPTLSPVEKLQYLKTSLTGSAALLLKNTALSGDNFHRAWDDLIFFYENKRLLVNSALSSLISLKRMTKESAAELEKLYTHIMEIYRTLENLKRPIEHWDDFLVFIVSQRLDSDSVKAWEQLLGSAREPPTWKTDLLIFY